jgi:hypothetical protein
MARSTGRDWSLDNAEVLHDMHPHSFFIPSADRRHNLRPDDEVRLVFLVWGKRSPGSPSGERMWLTDINRIDDGRYVGTLTNQPAFIKDLGQGDEIEFGPEHVIAILDPDAIPDDIKAFAARRLIEDDTLVPWYVYHDPSEAQRPASHGRRSSGWCLLVGDETEELLADADQILLPSLGWLVERYPAFGEIVRTGVSGREYEWDPDAGRYMDIGPYQETDE